MSNKKRISRKVNNIQKSKHLKIMTLACKAAVDIINMVVNERRMHLLAIEKYPKGGLIPNDGIPEKLIDSHGDEMVMPKFEVKRHNSHYLDTHKPIQS